MDFRLIQKWAICAVLFFNAVAANSQMPPADSARTDSTVVIDFENIATTGLGEGGQARVTTQYPGVIFNSPWVMDYSKGISIPEFARSGTRAIMLCYGVEFCSDTTFVLRFAEPQRKVRVWTGAPRLREPTTITLVASDINGQTVASAQARLEPTQPPRIKTPLEVSVDSNRISTVVVHAANAYQSDIAVDDIEFAKLLPARQQSIESGPIHDIRVPYVVGKPLDEARRILSDAGLNVGMIGEVRVAGSIGTVWTQHPDSGALAKPNESVNLDIVIAPPRPWWDDFPWPLLVAAVMTLVGIITWRVLKRSQPAKPPAFAVQPRLAKSGVDQQTATFFELTPINLKIQLSVNPDSLHAVTSVDYKHHLETEK